MQFMLALGAVFVLVVIGACYLLGGFVARRSPRLLVALGGALLGLSCWFLFTGIHLYRLSETVHGADGWASLGPFLLGALRILVGLVLLPCAAPMLIRARDTAARRLIPLAFIPVLAVGAYCGLPYWQNDQQLPKPTTISAVASRAAGTPEEERRAGAAWARENSITRAEECLRLWEQRESNDLVSGCTEYLRTRR